MDYVAVECINLLKREIKLYFDFLLIKPYTLTWENSMGSGKLVSLISHHDSSFLSETATRKIGVTSHDVE